MKSLFVLLVLAVAALAQTNSVAMYAGTNNGTTWNPPVLDDNSTPPTCTAGTVTAYGAYFDYNVTVAGVFHVSVMTEGSFDSYVQIFVYTDPFSAATPCTNVVIKNWEKEIGEGGGPVIADFAYMGVGRYWFVVTATTADTVGQVAIHVYPPISTGMTTAAGARWLAPYGDSTCTGGAGTASDPVFGTFTWTQNGTDQFDIVAGWYNATDNDFSSTYLSLYTGTVAPAAITADSCAGNLFPTYEYDNGLTIWNVTLTTGTTYTVATSPSYSDEYGYWGIWVVPTRAAMLWDTPTWNQPNRDMNCTDSGSPASWFADTIIATGQVTIIDTQTLPSGQGYSYVDTYSWFFRGNQSTAVPPPTCGGRIITYGDTGDITPVYGITIPGRIYTAIVSTYSGSTNVGNFGLFTYSGFPLGFIPPSDETTGAADGADGGDGGDGDGGDGDGDGDGDEDDAASGVFYSVALTAAAALIAQF